MPDPREGDVECQDCGRRYIFRGGHADCSEARFHRTQAQGLAEEVGGEVVVATTGVPIVVFPGDHLEVA